MSGETAGFGDDNYHEPLRKRIVFCADFPFYFFIIYSEKINDNDNQISIANKMLFMGKVNTINDI